MKTIVTKTPIECLFEIFGEKQALAAAAGVTPSAVRKWQTRGVPGAEPGHVPQRYNAAIIAGAKRAGISRARVARHLDTDTCPLCGGKLAAGRHIHPQAARRFAETMGRKNGTNT